MSLDPIMVGARQWALDLVIARGGDPGGYAGLPTAVDAAYLLAIWLSTGRTLSQQAADAGGGTASSPAPAAAAIAQGRKLGREPMRADAAARLPQLARIAAGLPPAPIRFTAYLDAVQGWILGKNDQIGDCTCVAAANIILALTTLAGDPLRLTDDQVVALYERFGYAPADPNTDRGALIEDVLASWHAQGIADARGFDRLDGFAMLDVRNHDQVRQAIAHLGPVDLGVDLPNGWMQATTWDVATAGEGIAGGHCITAVGYTEEGPLVVSWGQVFPLTWAGWDAYADEAHALLSRDAMTAAGKTADGVDWAGLERAMAQLRVA